MKIKKIETHREYEASNLSKLSITIDFDTSNPSNKPDGDALYYLICALDKHDGKSHKDLDVMERIQVLNRLESAIAKLQEIKKEINLRE